MRRALSHLRTRIPTPILPFLSKPPLSTAPATASLPLSTATVPAPAPSLPSKPLLSSNDIAKIHHMIPHLCSNGRNLPTAITLLTTCLQHTSTPLRSLPFHIIIPHLSPSLSISLLSSLSLNHSVPLSTSLLSNYFRNCRPGDAMEVYDWMRRREEGVAVDGEVQTVVVVGLCRCRMVREAVGVLIDLVRRGGTGSVAAEAKKMVYWGLIREARVSEAVEFENGLIGDGNEGFDVLAVLERIVAEWKD